MKLQKETLCLQAFIMKRSFILNSIASETGHFLEMVHLVHRILSLQLTVVENKTFKEKDINRKHKLIYRWIKLQKDTISLWSFIVKTVFILNSIAFKTGHSLKWYSQCTEYCHCS